MDDTDSLTPLPRTLKMAELLKPPQDAEKGLLSSIKAAINGPSKFAFPSLPAELRDEVCRHCDIPTLFNLSHTAKIARFHAHNVLFSELYPWFIVQPKAVIEGWRNVVNAPGHPNSVLAPCLLAASYANRLRIGGAPFRLDND